MQAKAPRAFLQSPYTVSEKHFRLRGNVNINPPPSKLAWRFGFYNFVLINSDTLNKHTIHQIAYGN